AQFLYGCASARSRGARRQRHHLARLHRISGGLSEGLFWAPPLFARYLWLHDRDELRLLPLFARGQGAGTPPPQAEGHRAQMSEAGVPAAKAALVTGGARRIGRAIVEA